MEVIDTKIAAPDPSDKLPEVFDAGRVEDLPHGKSKTIDLPEGRELALFNVNGEFYATENFCPHKGAPLSSGLLCEHVVECDWHGWQFDVRTGECLTVPEKLETYEVVVEEDRVKILI
jgi:3-phenylpropionate/trans-cinnamate dioxygenase ferredoxin subunit